MKTSVGSETGVETPIFEARVNWYLDLDIFRLSSNTTGIFVLGYWGSCLVRGLMSGLVRGPVGTRLEHIRSTLGDPRNEAKRTQVHWLGKASIKGL